MADHFPTRVLVHPRMSTMDKMALTMAMNHRRLTSLRTAHATAMPR